MHWRRILLVGATAAIVMRAAAGCSSFGEDSVSVEAGQAEGGSDATPLDGGAESGADAGACKGGRDGALATCGTTIPCDLKLRANTCCFPGNGLTVFECRAGAVNCPATQQNCAGTKDCSGGEPCCQNGNVGGTSCMSKCPADRICAADDECKVGEICLAPTSTQKYWHCGACP